MNERTINLVVVCVFFVCIGCSAGAVVLELAGHQAAAATVGLLQLAGLALGYLVGVPVVPRGAVSVPVPGPVPVSTTVSPGQRAGEVTKPPPP